MKKKLLLCVIAISIFSFTNAQVIDLIGLGVVDNTTANLTPTDVSNIDHVDVGAIYSRAPISSTAVTFSSVLETPTTNFFDYTNIVNQTNGTVPDPINGAYFTATFNNIDNNGVNINIDDLYKSHVQSFYAFVYRNIPNATYKSFMNSDVVYFYHNGINDPYVFNIPIETATAPRNITVKIPVSELDDQPRNLIIDITAGSVSGHYEEYTYNFLNSLFIGEYTLENIPGDVDNIAVSVYSPAYIAGSQNGDSFYISGVVADVDKVEEDCGECEGKVTSLEMQYNGSTDATIKVTDKKGNEVIFEGLVSAGGAFNLEGFDKKGTLGTEIILYIDGVQNTKIHTSCSKPIGPGLVSGSFEVLGGVSREGGILCPVDTPPNGGDCGDCEGKVTWLEMQYNGSTDATILVLGKKEGNIIFEGDVVADGTFNLTGFDKKNTLGTEIILYVDGVQNTKIHTSCSKPIGPGLISGDFEVLSGASRNGGELCPVDVPPTPPNGGDCGECEGKATNLTLRYDGTVAAQITVTQKKNNVVVFDGIVNSDEEFSFVGTDKGTLGTEITIKVDGEVNAKIHTSCSVPLYIGLVSGDFTIVDGYSKKGGQLCETSNKTLKTASFDSCDGCGTVLTYPNPASDFVTIRFKPENSVNTKVILFNLYGQSVDVLYNNVVERDREREIKYNVEKLTNGLYFVKIINGSSTLTKKIIVSK